MLFVWILPTWCPRILPAQVQQFPDDLHNTSIQEHLLPRKQARASGTCYQKEISFTLLPGLFCTAICVFFPRAKLGPDRASRNAMVLPMQSFLSAYAWHVGCFLCLWSLNQICKGNSHLSLFHVSKFSNKLQCFGNTESSDQHHDLQQHCSNQTPVWGMSVSGFRDSS